MKDVEFFVKVYGNDFENILKKMIADFEQFLIDEDDEKFHIERPLDETFVRASSFVNAFESINEKTTSYSFGYDGSIGVSLRINDNFIYYDITNRNKLRMFTNDILNSFESVLDFGDIENE